MHMILDHRVLVVGLVRNVEKSIFDEVMRHNKTFKLFKSTEWLLIESDSHDNTIAELNALKKQLNNFSYISLGNLRDRYPLRTQRIAECRNNYLDIINNDENYKNVNYIIVMDLDNLNKKINKEAIMSSFKFDEWDAVFANQDGLYYDIWALRHKYWSPNDVFDVVDFYSDFMNSDAAKIKAIFSRFIRINKNHDPIQVESAFGGFGIYKKELFLKSRYDGLINKKEICEHVSFHKNLVQKGYKLYINPKMINAHKTEHTKTIKMVIVRLKYLIKTLLLRRNPR